VKYLFLIYAAEQLEDSFPPEQMGEIFQQYGAFTRDLEERGVLRGGEPLERSTTATSVRVRDGRRLITDGPFAETKEQLGGFYLVECRDLDEALELAAKVPSASFGTIEVRPVMDLGAAAAEQE
jgi:hypothetical protein